MSSQFELTNDVAIEDCVSKIGGRTSKYPFAQMAPGQSFHVATSDECPKPQARLAGAVGGANKKLKAKGLKMSVLNKVD